MVDSLGLRGAVSARMEHIVAVGVTHVIRGCERDRLRTRVLSLAEPPSPVIQVVDQTEGERLHDAKPLLAS